jgi:hypothetical protein
MPARNQAAAVSAAVLTLLGVAACGTNHAADPEPLAQQRSSERRESRGDAPTGEGAGSTVPRETLSDELSRSGGTIRPPPGIDPEMAKPPPDPGPQSMPVIPPPGTPGGDPSVKPK